MKLTLKQKENFTMDAQSKKEFIGLTDDEINDISICEQISPDRLWHIYIAIE